MSMIVCSPTDCDDSSVCGCVRRHSCQQGRGLGVDPNGTPHESRYVELGAAAYPVAEMLSSKHVSRKGVMAENEVALGGRVPLFDRDAISAEQKQLFDWLTANVV